MARSIRVLIADDSLSTAALLTNILRDAGYEPDTLRVDTLEQLDTALAQSRWDLILSDYHLCQFCVLDLLERRRNLDLPVIVVSKQGGEERVVAAMHAGAHDFMLAGDLDRLVPAIERELEEMVIHREHRKVSEALRESEQRFRQLTEAIPEVFWLIDAASGEVIYLSPAFEDVWEFSADAFIENPKVLLDSIYPDDFAQMEEQLALGIEQIDADYRIVLADDSVRWIATRSYPIRDRDGRIYRYAGLSLDVSESKEMEAGVKHLTRALEQTADMVMIADTSGHITYVNNAFELVTGYSREELIGQSPRMLQSGLQSLRFYEDLWNNLINGLPFVDIFINRRKNNEVYYQEQTISPVKNCLGDVTHFVSTGKDITERLCAQERMNKVLHYDPVTGLANRLLLMDRLGQAVKAARILGHQLGLLCIGFSFSNLFGDGELKKHREQLLRQLAQRIHTTVGEMTTVAHLNEDEFVVLYQKSDTGEEFERLAQRLFDAFAVPIAAGGYELFLTPFIGISLSPSYGDDLDTLLHQSELAMRYVQKHPSENCLFYSESLQSVAPLTLTTS